MSMNTKQTHKNSAVLLGIYGDDYLVCNAAWASTGVSLSIEELQELPLEQRNERLFIETMKTKKKSPRDLLMMLGEHQHFSPFERIGLHFQLVGDVSTHVQMLKHRIGTSINSSSFRYKEQPDQYYLPDDWKNIHLSHDENIAVGNILNDSAHSFGTWYDVLDEVNVKTHELYHLATTALTKRLGRKRAKESARFFLPYSRQLTYDCLMNMRSFHHFINLRADDAAQKEIQEIAKSMLQQVYDSHQVDFSLEALGLLKYLPN